MANHKIATTFYHIFIVTTDFRSCHERTGIRAASPNIMQRATCRGTPISLGRDLSCACSKDSLNKSHLMKRILISGTQTRLGHDEIPINWYAVAAAADTPVSVDSSPLE